MNKKFKVVIYLSDGRIKDVFETSDITLISNGESRQKTIEIVKTKK
ncbi:hypothetical protein [Flagellimonas sp.]